MSASIWAPGPAVGADLQDFVSAPVIPNDILSASYNSAILSALAAQYDAGLLGSVKLAFPDGIVYYDAQIRWRSPPVGVADFSTTSLAESVMIEFASVGTTKLVYVGAQAPSQSPGVGIASWTVEGNSASLGGTIRKLRFSNIDFVGPEIQLTSYAIATTAITADAVTSVSLEVGATVVVGDAIGIVPNVVVGLLYNPIWWATVTSVAGTNPVIATFDNQPTCANFRAAIGNRVVVAKQTRALQIGGVRASAQDVFFYTEFNNCNFIDWFSCLAISDCTWVKFKDTSFVRSMFGVEHGYNIDSCAYEFPSTNCQFNSRTGTTAIGLRTVTGLSESTATLRIGMTLGEQGVTTAFKETAVIQSIDSLTQVTMSEAAATAGAKTFQPMMTEMICVGRGVSPFYPLATTGLGARQDNDLITVNGGAYAEAKIILRSDGISQGAFTAEDNYPELTGRLAVIGNQGPLGGGPFTFRRTKIQSPTSFLGPPIEALNGSTPAFVIEDAVSPATPLFFPFLKQQIGATSNIVWNRNNLTTSSANGLIYPDQNWTVGSWNPGPTDQCYFTYNGAGASNYHRDFGVQAGPNASNNSREFQGIDTVMFTMSGSVLFGNPQQVNSAKGSRHRLVVQAQSTQTLSLGAGYVKADGTAIVIAAATGTNKFCVMDFVSDGTRHILVSSQTPVFI